MFVDFFPGEVRFSIYLRYRVYRDGPFIIVGYKQQHGFFNCTTILFYLC